MENAAELDNKLIKHCNEAVTNWRAYREAAKAEAAIDSEEGAADLLRKAHVSMGEAAIKLTQVSALTDAGRKAAAEAVASALELEEHAPEIDLAREFAKAITRQAA